MNCKRRGRKRPWSNLKALSRKLPGGAEENHEKSLRTAGLRAEMCTNPGPPEHEAGVLTTRPRRSVRNLQARDLQCMARGPNAAHKVFPSGLQTKSRPPT
jgi:hypothetical protein